MNLNIQLHRQMRKKWILTPNGRKYIACPSLLASFVFFECMRNFQRLQRTTNDISETFVWCCGTFVVTLCIEKSIRSELFYCSLRKYYEQKGKVNWESEIYQKNLCVFIFQHSAHKFAYPASINWLECKAMNKFYKQTITIHARSDLRTLVV